MLSSKNFYVDDKELALRTLWLAHSVVSRVEKRLFPYNPQGAPPALLEATRKNLFEIAGYIAASIICHIVNDIKQHYGWSEKDWQLYLSYKGFLAAAFNKVFDIEISDDEDSFDNIIDFYTDPMPYGNDYEDFWKVPNFDFLTGSKESENEWWQSNYSYEKLYVYRMSKIFDIQDKYKVLRNLDKYLGIPYMFYENAFFALSLDTVKQEIGNMCY